MKKISKKVKQLCRLADRFVERVLVGAVDVLVRICLFLDTTMLNKYSKRYRRRRMFAGIVAFSCAISFIVLLGITVASSTSFKRFPRSLSLSLLSTTPDMRLQKVVLEASLTYNVPKELIWAVIATESNFNPKAISPVGAMGLMQLMPQTAEYLQVADPWNSRDNVFGGTKYLRHLLDRFNGNLHHALAAYNAGPTSVRKYGGVPPYKETQGYVKKVLSRYNAEKQKAIGI